MAPLGYTRSAYGRHTYCIKSSSTHFPLALGQTLAHWAGRNVRKIDEELIAYAFSQQTSVGLHLLKPMDERGSGLATNVTFGIYREPSRYHAALEFALISPLDRDTYAQNEFVASTPR